MIELTLQQALANWDILAKDDRIVRGSDIDLAFGELQHTDSSGRRIAGWLGALDPSINSADDVPVSMMPRWFAELAIHMCNHASDEKWMGFMGRYRAVLEHIDSLSLSALDQVRDLTLISALEIAVGHDKSNVVQPTIDLLLRRLKGEDVSVEINKAAEAARAVKANPSDAKEGSPTEYMLEAEAMSAMAVVFAASGHVASASHTAAQSEEYGKFTFSVSYGTRRLAFSEHRAAWDKITETCLRALEFEMGLSS